MARGYPDYFGISAWPRYGSPVLDNHVDAALAAGASVDLHDVTCQGIAYAMLAVISDHVAFATSILNITIDGITWPGFILSGMSGLGGMGSQLFPFAMPFDDVLLETAVVTLSREMPFRTSFKVSITNGSADSFNVQSYLYYYQVN